VDRSQPCCVFDINHGISIQMKREKRRSKEKINFIVVLMRTLHFSNERFIRWNSNGQITLRSCVWILGNCIVLGLSKLISSFYFVIFADALMIGSWHTMLLIHALFHSSYIYECTWSQAHTKNRNLSSWYIIVYIRELLCFSMYSTLYPRNFPIIFPKEQLLCNH